MYEGSEHKRVMYLPGMRKEDDEQAMAHEQPARRCATAWPGLRRVLSELKHDLGAEVIFLI